MKIYMLAAFARKKETPTFIEIGVAIVITTIALCFFAVVGLAVAAAFYGFIFFLMGKLFFDRLKEIRWKRMFRNVWAKIRGKKAIHEDTYPNTTAHILRQIGDEASPEEAQKGTLFDTSVSPLTLLRREP